MDLLTRTAEPMVMAALMVMTATGCGAHGLRPDETGWADGTPRRALGDGRIGLRFSQRLTPTFEGAYQPVERAVPVLDPPRNRVYVGSTAGKLYALTVAGLRLYRYDAGSSIEAQPVLDPARDELYIGTEQGELHALTAGDGALRWRKGVGGPLRRTPVLTEDAVYVVTDSDRVVALSRDTGETLWSYHRDPPEGFSITEHAGLVLHEGSLITAFTDGTIVALGPADGSVLWEHDTSLEVESDDDSGPRFVDVDTTPCIMDDTVYVASFAGGLYGLDFRTGTVLLHESGHTGIVAIEAAPDASLILSSADEGVLRIDPRSGEVIWRHALERGAPTAARISGATVLVGSTVGAFLGLDLDTGREVARIEAGHGFSAPAAVASGLGFVVSNGGSLMAFRIDGGANEPAPIRRSQWN